jgi:hypothetical protein
LQEEVRSGVHPVLARISSDELRRLVQEVRLARRRTPRRSGGMASRNDARVGDFRPRRRAGMDRPG